jgi:hypothetical protein
MIRLAIILYNCLVVSGFQIETQENMSPITIPVNFTAMGDANRRDVETGSYNPPYRVLDFSDIPA